MLLLAGCAPDDAASDVAAPTSAVDSVTVTTDESTTPTTGGPVSAWPQTIEIMAFGDSITEAPQYRSALVDRLTDDGCDFDMVGTRNRFADEVADADHEGYARWSAAELAGIAQDRAATVEPDIVIVHAGTNDLAGGATPEEAVASVRSIVTELHEGAPEATVIVAQIIPYEADRGEVAVFNRLVVDLVAELNDSAPALVALVDVNTGFDLARHARDGVHPNDEGGAHLATEFFNALVDINGPCERETTPLDGVAAD